jgi:CRISPR-associated protein Cas5d
MEQKHIIVFDVWGDRALFTRPEFAAERVTYDVPTPTAMQGVAQSIYAKPEFDTEVIAIEVLQRGRKEAYRGNFVKSKANQSLTPIDITADRTQRASTILRDVAYRVRLQLLANEHTDDLAKHFSIFRKRLDKGRCFQRPYLGCREFAAFFSHPREGIEPISWSEELGLLLTGFQQRDPIGVPIFSRAWVDHGCVKWEPLC